MTTKKTTRKPAPLPCIDLRGLFQVIDDTQDPLRWKTISEGYATAANARRVARQHGLCGIWINDGFGRKYVTVNGR